MTWYGDRVTIRVRKLPNKPVWRCSVTYPRHPADEVRGLRYSDGESPEEALKVAVYHLQKRLAKRATHYARARTPKAVVAGAPGTAP